MTEAGSRTEGDAFGVLRLVFAALVIVSHGYALVDGNTARDPLVRLFNAPLTLGEVAVDGFFLVSGFLVTTSWIKTGDGARYFAKRILRIYPAYVAAVMVTRFVIGPLGGGVVPAFAPGPLLATLLDAVRLKVPDVPGAFAGLPAPSTNGSMWTISYEFRCYILVALAGWAGLYRRRWAYLAITAALLLAHALWRAGLLSYPIRSVPGVGEVERVVRLFGCFMAGGCFKLFAGRIALVPRGAAIVAAGLAAALFTTALAELAVATLGAYIVFFVARFAPAWLKRANTRNDVSYGLYLYAWPITKLLQWHGEERPLALIAETLPLALLAGAASWFLVERWAVRLKPLGRRPGAGTPATAGASLG